MKGKGSCQTCFMEPKAPKSNICAKCIVTFKQIAEAHSFKASEYEKPVHRRSK